MGLAMTGRGGSDRAMPFAFPSLPSALLALVAVLVSGCATVTSPLPAVRPPDLMACGAVNLQHLVGQKVDVLEALNLPGPRRIIRPGQAVTLDFNAARLDVDIDENGVITRIWCG